MEVLKSVMGGAMVGALSQDFMPLSLGFGESARGEIKQGELMPGLDTFFLLPPGGGGPEWGVSSRPLAADDGEETIFCLRIFAALAQEDSLQEQ